MDEKMTTRAKFQCDKVEKVESWNGKDKFLYKAHFVVVCTGSDENEKFFASTPSGEMTIGVYADDRFVPGKQYYLDITEA